MIIDTLTQFADNVTLPTAIATANVGDILDTGLQGRDIGQGQPVYLIWIITAAVTSATAPTVIFQLVSDATSTISTTTQTVHMQSAAFVKATLVAGFTLVMPIPSESPAYEKFVGVQTITATAVLTAGAVDAFLSLDNHGWKSYPDAVN